MGKQCTPQIFRQLEAEGYITGSDILKTEDGFWAVYKSLSDILENRGIYDFPGSKGIRLACNKFYDDWFLYAVPAESDYTYSLFKLREQEHDAEDGIPADGDTPGVTISFISFSCHILLACLANPTDENRVKLDNEINRVVARRRQHHHNDLKRYFVNPAAEGSYLVANLYAKHIASFARDGYLEVPKHYREIVTQSAARKHSKQLARLPRFLDALNREAGYVVCDHEKVYIKDASAPDPLECAAILATHTGNTSIYSFAAEVEYHARFLVPIARFKILLLGKSVYESAIRADMSVGDAEFQGPAPFYRPNSPIVMKQYRYHKDDHNFCNIVPNKKGAYL